MHFLRLKLIFLVILIVSSVGGFLNHQVYAATTSDGTVASSVKIASGTNGGPTLANTDEFGNSVANIGDLNGNGVTDLAVGAFGDATGGADRGATHILFMNSDGTVASSVKIASGTNGGPTLANGDSFGASVANIGDLNGDGVTDLAVGANGDETGGADRGAVYILFMNSDGTVKSSPAPVKIASGTNGGPTLTNGDQFGVSVANIGDLNGNGVTDLAVGTYLDDTGGTNRGAVYILFMNSDGTVASSVKIASGTNGGPTLADSDQFGISVANIGDLNGNGVTDLAVGSFGDDTGGTDRGATYILFMNSDGTVASSVKIASGTNGGPTLADSDQFGFSVANIGDLNGNGATDLAVGAFADDTSGTNRGAVYILFMNSDGTVASSVKIASGTNGGPTLADGDQFGASVANIGDFNGNVINELAVGARFDDTGGTDRGAIYILFLTTIVTSPATSSGGGCKNCTPPSFTFAFSDDQYPLIINENTFKLPGYSNHIDTVTVKTNTHTTIQLLLYDDLGPQSIQHVGLFTDFGSNSPHPQYSNTNIVWDKSGITYHDTDENILEYTIDTAEKDDKFEITFDIVFAKPVGTQDMVIRVWDENRNAFDTIIYDALNIVENNIPTQEPVEGNVEENTMNLLAETKDDTHSVLIKWSGYSQESATDHDMLEALDFKGNYIPHWVKETFGQGIHDGKLKVEDLSNALEYLIKMKIVQ